MKDKLMNFFVAVMCAIPLGMLFGWVPPLNIGYEETRQSNLVISTIIVPVLAAILLLIFLTPFNFIIRKIKLKPYWATVVPAALASILTISNAIDLAGTAHTFVPGFDLESVQRQADAPTIIFISITCLLSCILSPYCYSRNFWPELPGFRQFSKKITLPVTAGWLLAANYPVVQDTTTIAMAEAGNSTAQMKLANMYHENLDPAYSSLIKIFTRPEPEEEARRKNKNALKWLTKAAEQGNTASQEILIDNPDRYLDSDDQKFTTWTESITSPKLQIELSEIYSNGKGVPEDKKKAFDWMMKAAEQGNAHAQYVISNYYYNGDGTDKNYEKSFEWMMKVAEQGRADAQYEIGRRYYNGHGIDKNYEKSFEWMGKAAQGGDSAAQYALAMSYAFGEGTAKDIKKALEWLRKAAASGNVAAQLQLDEIDSK